MSDLRLYQSLIFLIYVRKISPVLKVNIISILTRSKAADGIDELIEELKTRIQKLARTSQGIYEYYCARCSSWEIYLKSAASGAGKTRGLLEMLVLLLIQFIMMKQLVNGFRMEVMR